MSEQQTIPELDFGPLQPLMNDSNVLEIMVNGYDHIYVERRGQMEAAESGFRDNDHLTEVIRQIAAANGVNIDASQPIIDLSLSDGARVHIVLPPVAPR